MESTNLSDWSDWKNKFLNRSDIEKPVGRFAPSPTGFMHLGNVWAALIAWLEVRKLDGTMILRMEDLDPERSKPHFTERVISDMRWLGLDWNEGPDCGGQYGPYHQDSRRDIYQSALEHLKKEGLVYPCFCTRKELRAASAPHREDGQFIYSGHCKSIDEIQKNEMLQTKRHAWRIQVPNEIITFEDLNYGTVKQNIAQDCGDFVLTRADGVHAYQLAVVVDDALMGVNHVVRGSDLLDSSPRQVFLHRVLGFPPPQFGHVPLLRGENSERLSKRHKALDLETLREQGWQAEEVLGLLGFKAGLIGKNESITAKELISEFDWSKLPKDDITLTGKDLVKSL